MGPLFGLRQSKCNMDHLCAVEEISINIYLVAGTSDGFNYFIRERCKKIKVQISAKNNYDHSVDILGKRWLNKSMKIYLKYL